MIPLQNSPSYPHLPVIPGVWNINQAAPSLFHQAQGGLPIQGGLTQQHRNQFANVAFNSYSASGRVATGSGNPECTGA